MRKSTLANVTEQLLQNNDVVIKCCVGILIPKEESLPQDFFQNKTILVNFQL